MAPVYLVGVDGSNCGQRAIDYASERALATKGKVLVAHVIEWSPYSFNTPQENEQRHQRREEELKVAHERVIGPIVEAMREKGVEAEGVVRHGQIAHTLAKLAEEFDTTSVIVGRHGTSRFKTQIFGSVPSKLVQIIERPLTVVP